jgi:putative nucleotidyltransferase with HDIG domain
MRPDRAHDLSPAVERLMEQGRTRRHERVLGPELRGEIVAVAAFLVAAIALAAGAGAERAFDAPLAACLVAAYAVLASTDFRTGTGVVAPTQIVFVPMLLLLPTPLVPLLVAAAVLVSATAEAVRGHVAPARIPFGIADAWFAIGPAATLVLLGAQTPDWGDAPAYVAALAAQFACDGVVTLLRARRDGARPAEVLVELRQGYRFDALLAPVGLLAAFGAVGAPFAVLLVLPLVALFAIFAREREARIDQALQLSQAYKGTALLLGDVIEADDQYTGDHTKDVVELTLLVADRLGVDEETRRGAEFGALLHDVGKIHIPNAIINKPGPLDDDEWAVMKTHTVEGQRMLERVGGALARVGVVVRASHERWDGGGYPDGLAGEAIPLAARIVSACDAYNAMTTDRSYRRALPVADAIAELERCAGSQFDPAVVAALIDVAVATVPQAPAWQLTLTEPGRDAAPGGRDSVSERSTHGA